MNKPLTDAEILQMSDEDIMNTVEAPDMAEPDIEETPSNEDETHQEAATEEQAEPVPEEADDDAAEEEINPLSNSDDHEDTPETVPDEEEGASGGNEGVKTQLENEDEPEVADTPSTDSEETPIDYKAAYEELMMPFKANGREVKLETPAEVKHLMQMGANYTKKMQALQPNLKMLRMLENNGLLDEDKISNLIDLDKKNPKAIHKLVKDAGVDPMDIDPETESDYKPGNYRISDEEVAFTSAIEEVTTRPAGREMIRTIKDGWDEKSKDMLWKEPNVLQIVTDHKENGIYDRICNEVERRKVLGNLSNEPFLTSYLNVGQELQQAGALQIEAPENNKADPDPAPVPKQSKIVETRSAAKPKTGNSDNARARATSPLKSSPTKARADFNPLSMSDEDFEKSEALSGRI
jgi:hypothetical protein